MMKVLIFSKYSVFLSDFPIFPTKKFFLIFAKKTLKIRWKDIFKKKYHMRRIVEKISHI